MISARTASRFPRLSWRHTKRLLRRNVCTLLLRKLCSLDDVNQVTSMDLSSSTYMPACSSRVSNSIATTHHLKLSIDFLSDSPYIDDLDHIIRCFDKTTKLRFRDANEPQYVKFGSARDNDEAFSIRFGQLKLLGYKSDLASLYLLTLLRTDVSIFFQPSVDCIINAVQEQRRLAHKSIQVGQRHT